MITFSQAYSQLGPDTMAIAESLSITEAEADRLINERMESKARSAQKWQHTKRQLAEMREARG